MSLSPSAAIDLRSWSVSSNNTPMFCHSLAIGMSILNALDSCGLSAATAAAEVCSALLYWDALSGILPPGEQLPTVGIPASSKYNYYYSNNKFAHSVSLRKEGEAWEYPPLRKL